MRGSQNILYSKSVKKRQQHIFPRKLTHAEVGKLQEEIEELLFLKRLLSKIITDYEARYQPAGVAHDKFRIRLSNLFDLPRRELYPQVLEEIEKRLIRAGFKSHSVKSGFLYTNGDLVTLLKNYKEDVVKEHKQKADYLFQLDQEYKEKSSN